MFNILLYLKHIHGGNITRTLFQINGIYRNEINFGTGRRLFGDVPTTGGADVYFGFDIILYISCVRSPLASEL